MKSKGIAIKNLEKLNVTSSVKRYWHAVISVLTSAKIAKLRENMEIVNKLVAEY